MYLFFFTEAVQQIIPILLWMKTNGHLHITMFLCT
jgi:hypothetical protein